MDAYLSLMNKTFNEERGRVKITPQINDTWHIKQSRINIPTSEGKSEDMKDKYMQDIVSSYNPSGGVILAAITDTKKAKPKLPNIEDIDHDNIITTIIDYKPNVLFTRKLMKKYIQELDEEEI